MGTSMGAAAILRAISVYNISPKAIVLECPFGSMYETVCARFKIMHFPCFPMAFLLVFWGGVQNGFWAFSHNPTDYARNVHCKALLMYGEQDLNVSRAETDEIYTNLAGAKKLLLLKNAGHENYLLQYRNEWVSAVAAFLERN
jgi:pimeloyl-ACP methyl ester carboxylesterase